MNSTLPFDAAAYAAKSRATLGLVIALIAAFAYVFGQQAGVIPTVIVAGSMTGGTICWFLTTARRPADPARVIPIYIVTALLLLVHITEEWIGPPGFAPAIAKVFVSTWNQGEFFVMFCVILPLFWIGGIALLYKRHPLGNWIAWFIWTGMILGEPAHLLTFPLKAAGRYDYFPGMWTALFPLVLGIWGMVVLVSDYRRGRS